MFVCIISLIFKRAVVTPMSSMEALWRDYNSFEQGVNMQLAEKLIHDKTRDHMIARKVAKVTSYINNCLWFPWITKQQLSGYIAVPLLLLIEECFFDQL